MILCVQFPIPITLQKLAVLSNLVMILDTFGVHYQNIELKKVPIIHVVENVENQLLRFHSKDFSLFSSLMIFKEIPDGYHQTTQTLVLIAYVSVQA